MYLLKRSSPKLYFMCSIIFTFHHVSIKTFFYFNNADTIFSFTFHHVSIKTIILVKRKITNPNFTFHHVSIKTVPLGKRQHKYLSFTFHHVSIKTKRPYKNIIYKLCLYIPPCIY